MEAGSINVPAPRIAPKRKEARSTAFANLGGYARRHTIQINVLVESVAPHLGMTNKVQNETDLLPPMLSRITLSTTLIISDSGATCVQLVAILVGGGRF